MDLLFLFLLPKRKRNQSKSRSNLAPARIFCSLARKKLDLRGGVLPLGHRRLPQIIQQVFRSGPLPKAALSGFARRSAGA
jgi:hypothetical protein